MPVTAENILASALEFPPDCIGNGPSGIGNSQSHSSRLFFSCARIVLKKDIAGPISPK